MNDYPAVLRRNLRNAVRGGELDAAADLLDQLKAEDPLALETRCLELEYLVRSERLGDAERLAGQLLGLFPEVAKVHYLAGVTAYRRKDYPAAAERFAESLRLAPLWKAEHWLGKTYTQAGRFDEAEPLLLALVDEHPRCRRDLAWLYERRGDEARALAEVERFLAEFPDDPLARQQVQRLRARQLDPEELREEVEVLEDLGEEVPAELLPEYVETLLAAGETERVRELMAGRADALEPRAAVGVAWKCHHHALYDVAYTLFLRDFARQRNVFKYLTALEKSAAGSGRLEELIAFYEEQAPGDGRFYGRARSLRKRLAGGVAEDDFEYE